MPFSPEPSVGFAAVRQDIRTRRVAQRHGGAEGVGRDPGEGTGRPMVTVMVPRRGSH